MEDYISKMKSEKYKTDDLIDLMSEDFYEILEGDEPYEKRRLQTNLVLMSLERTPCEKKITQKTTKNKQLFVVSRHALSFCLVADGTASLIKDISTQKII